MALEPIRRKFGLKQIIVSTYQAASGAGQAAIEELKKEAQDYLDGKGMQQMRRFCQLREIRNIIH